MGGRLFLGNRSQLLGQQKLIFVRGPGHQLPWTPESVGPHNLPLPGPFVLLRLAKVV